MAKLLIAIHEKNLALPGGNAHAVRSGYTSINTNPAVSGLQKQQLLATTSITLQEEHLSYQRRVL